MLTARFSQHRLLAKPHSLPSSTKEASHYTELQFQDPDPLGFRVRFGRKIKWILPLSIAACPNIMIPKFHMLYILLLHRSVCSIISFLFHLLASLTGFKTYRILVSSSFFQGTWIYLLRSTCIAKSSNLKHTTNMVEAFNQATLWTRLLIQTLQLLWVVMLAVFSRTPERSLITRMLLITLQPLHLRRTSRYFYSVCRLLLFTRNFRPVRLS